MDKLYSIQPEFIISITIFFPIKLVKHTCIISKFSKEEQRESYTPVSIYLNYDYNSINRY